MKIPLTFILALISGIAFGQSNLPSCHGDDQEKRNGCVPSQNVNNDINQDDHKKEEAKFELAVDDLVDEYQKRSNIKFDKNLNFPDTSMEYKYKYKYKYKSPKK